VTLRTLSDRGHLVIRRIFTVNRSNIRGIKDRPKDETDDIP